MHTVFLLLSVIAIATAQTTLQGSWSEDSPDNYGGFDYYCIDGATNTMTGIYSEIGWVKGTVTPDGRNFTGQWYEPLTQGFMTLYMVNNNYFSGSWTLQDGTGGGAWNGARVGSASPGTAVCSTTYNSIVGSWVSNIVQPVLTVTYTGNANSFPFPLAATFGTGSSATTVTLVSQNGGRTAAGTLTNTLTGATGSVDVARNNDGGVSMNATFTTATVTTSFTSMTRVANPTYYAAYGDTLFNQITSSGVLIIVILAFVLAVFPLALVAVILLLRKGTSGGSSSEYGSPVGSPAVPMQTISNPAHRKTGV